MATSRCPLLSVLHLRKFLISLTPSFYDDMPSGRGKPNTDLGFGLPAAEAGVSAYGLLVLHSLQTSPLISSFLLLSFTPLILFQYSPLLHAHRKPIAVSR